MIAGYGWPGAGQRSHRLPGIFARQGRGMPPTCRLWLPSSRTPDYCMRTIELAALGGETCRLRNLSARLKPSTNQANDQGIRDHPADGGAKSVRLRGHDLVPGRDDGAEADAVGDRPRQDKARRTSLWHARADRPGQHQRNSARKQWFPMSSLTLADRRGQATRIIHHIPISKANPYKKPTTHPPLRKANRPRPQPPL